MLPLWDSNMAISFHKYWNYNDQGSIQGMLNMRTQYQVPLWLGESGENSNTWTTDAISLAERNHISWTWWPLKKAGLNNPLEFHLGPGFRQIVAYWQGKGPRPSAADAYTALMQLASDVSTSANTYHKDVVDAMFRQVWSDQTLPYIPLTLQPGALVYAVNYDLGRNGFAYYDLDTANFRVSTGHNSGWNRGGCYRNDGVDINRCGDSLSNGYAVTDIERGEWLQYTVDVPKSGYYRVSYRVEPVTPSAADSVSAAPDGPAAWKLLDYVPGSGAVLLDACGLPAGAPSSDDPKIKQVSYVKPSVDALGDRTSEESETGPWTTAGNHKVYLKAGVHHLRLLAQEEGFRLSYIKFE
jgi:endoglucanase